MNKILRIAQAIGKRLEWFNTQAGLMAGILSIVMMIAIVREVVGRYLFNNPSNWSLELSCYLLVGLVYLGAAYTGQVEGHIRIDFIYGRFKGRTKAIADILISLVVLSYTIVLMWQGWYLAWDALINHVRSSDPMMWPLFPSRVMIPIGAFLLISVFIGKLSHSIAWLCRQGKA